MPVGSASVVNNVNTTLGDASGVVALGGIGGAGVADQEDNPIVVVNYLVTEAGDRLITESGDYLITET
jgi:hypothetical protein